MARNPALAGRDIAATRRACEEFSAIPIAIMNFVEGTRFTSDKHAKQDSPYQHLLKPKSGGVAFVLDAMGQGLHAILDVSIAYPAGKPALLDLLMNQFLSCGWMCASARFRRNSLAATTRTIANSVCVSNAG
ncbi:MAG: hypothetical protein U1F19_00475 [Lysobacterales bacterium]